MSDFNVRKERTGQRDLELSERHRRWGWNCPAVDLDFLEYDNGKAVALVEYKNEHAAKQDVNRVHPTHLALIDLGTRASIPVFGVRYSSDFSTWKVVPLNEIASKWSGRQELTELGWVRLLYKIRGRDVPKSVLDRINEAIP